MGGLKAGFYLYDRRVWVKDACWENSRWHSLSYRSVDEFEYIYIFWKPGITTIGPLAPEQRGMGRLGFAGRVEHPIRPRECRARSAIPA